MPSPQPGNAQVAGGQGGGVIGGQSIGIIGARGPANPTAPRVELSRDPIPVVDLAPELVEIFPGGTRRLAGGPSPIGPSTGTSYRGIRAGGTGSGALGMNLGLSIQYSLKVVELNKEGVILDVTVSDASKAILASKRLALNNYEEAIIELAADGGEKRLAIRFLPIISAAHSPEGPLRLHCAQCRDDPGACLPSFVRGNPSSVGIPDFSETFLLFRGYYDIGMRGSTG